MITVSEVFENDVVEVTDGSQIKVEFVETKNATGTEDEFLKQFSDKPVTEDPDKKGRDKLKGIIKYLKSKEFKKDVDRVSFETGKPPREVAHGVISKAFGIVGDILGIVVKTAEQTMNGLINLLSNILQSGVSLLANLAEALCRIVTFNKTAVGC
jgi:hypothetical protein